MLKPIVSALLLAAAFTGHAQTTEELYPKTIWCANDTFRIGYFTYPDTDTFKVSRTDKRSPGMDAAPGSYFTLYYNNDSLRLAYNNKIPYQHNYYINLESPKGKTTLRFHFNELMNYFPAAYMERNKGAVQFDIPEVYELAHIIWTLSPSGERATDLDKESPYYQKVKTYFKPYLDHPVFKALDFPDSIATQRYYEFRENSFAFNFEKPGGGVADTKLAFNGPYYYVYGDELADSSLFGKLKPLVEDFARRSKFRAFYKSNAAYYAQELKRQRELLPVAKMWSWLEEQFPKIKYQSYRVVSSPLIKGSHSTQGYTGWHNDAAWRESVMFICGAARYDRNPELAERQKEGLFSGVLFTEIDHNYVNRVTNRYAKQVDSIFAARGTWAKSGNSSDFYGSPVSVFNEYMTHAAFCVYVQDTYEKPVADYVIANREELMESRRNFIRFKAFNQELLRLHREDPQAKLADLYPQVLAWCRQQR